MPVHVIQVFYYLLFCYFVIVAFLERVILCLYFVVVAFLVRVIFVYIFTLTNCLFVLCLLSCFLGSSPSSVMTNRKLQVHQIKEEK